MAAGARSAHSRKKAMKPRRDGRREEEVIGGSVQGEGDQHGPLALDQVVAGRLAGGRRVTEDAQQVVAQLEGLAQRQAEGTQPAQLVGVTARQRGPDVQRALGFLVTFAECFGHRLREVAAVQD